MATPRVSSPKGRLGTEAHALDAKTAGKVPKKMIGRVLSPREVSALLDRLS